MNGETLISCLKLCLKSKTPLIVSFDDELESLPCLAGTRCAVLFAKRGQVPAHWTFLFCRGTTANYFDSLAGDLPPGLSRILDTSFNHWSCLSRPVQSSRATSCGHFCLYFCRKLVEGGSFEKIASAFQSSPDRKVNDRLVVSYVHKLFH